MYDQDRKFCSLLDYLYLLEFVSSHALQERLHNVCNGAT